MSRYNLKPPDETAMRDAANTAGWVAYLAAYNAATGEDRTMLSFKHWAYKLGIKPRFRAKSGPRVGHAYVPDAPTDDHREIQLRAQRIRLYKDAHGITGCLDDDQAEEAIHGDPDTWPDAPPKDKRSRPHLSYYERTPRVYRASLPTRRHGRAS